MPFRLFRYRWWDDEPAAYLCCEYKWSFRRRKSCAQFDSLSFIAPTTYVRTHIAVIQLPASLWTFFSSPLRCGDGKNSWTAIRFVVWKLVISYVIIAMAVNSRTTNKQSADRLQLKRRNGLFTIHSVQSWHGSRAITLNTLFIIICRRRRHRQRWWAIFIRTAILNVYGIFGRNATIFQQ